MTKRGRGPPAYALALGVVACVWLAREVWWAQRVSAFAAVERETRELRAEADALLADLGREFRLLAEASAAPQKLRAACKCDKAAEALRARAEEEFRRAERELLAAQSGSRRVAAAAEAYAAAAAEAGALAEAAVAREAARAREDLRAPALGVRGAASCSADEVGAAVTSTLRRHGLLAEDPSQYDFAQVAAGARVLPALTSHPLTPPGQRVPTFVWQAVGVDVGIGGPGVALDADNSFGNCFAFAGSRGTLALTLASRLHVTAVTVEHLRPNLCDPTRNRNCSSAPRDFRVLGWHGQPYAEDAALVVADGLRYDLALAAQNPAQTFPVNLTDSARPLEAVALQVLSNHGNREYTCVYRFQVHGHVA